MYVHHGARLIYLAGARTASTATGAALMRVGFKRPTPGDHHSELYYPHSPLTEETRHEWCVATTVRNHWDACVSWVAQRDTKHDKKVLPWPKEAFVSALDPARNSWVLKKQLYHRHVPHADVVFRFESLERDLKHWLTMAGLQMPFLAHDNVSTERLGAAGSKQHYSVFYDDDTAAYIGRRFNKEIERFGYRFERRPTNGSQTDRKDDDMTDDLLKRIDHLESLMQRMTTGAQPPTAMPAPMSAVPVTPPLEECAGCGSQAPQQPWVAIVHRRHLPSGVQPLAINEKDFCAVHCCASCWADSDHQTRPLKATFFDRANAQSGLNAAGIAGQIFLGGKR